MKIPKGFLKVVTVFIVLAVIGYIIVIRVLPVFQDTGQETPEMTRRQSEGKRMQEIPVQAARAFTGDLVMSISAKGTVKPFREIPIRTRVTGQLESVRIFEGKPVRAGELLIAIDDKDYQLAYKEAEANKRAAQIEYVYNRGSIDENNIRTVNSNLSLADIFIKKALEKWENADELLKTGKITSNEYNNRKRNYQIAQSFSGEGTDDIFASTFGLTSAETKYEKAKVDLDNTKIRAPISGVVAQLSVQEGQYLAQNTDICKIIDIRKVRIETGVLEPEVAYLEVDRKASITLSAYPGETFEGIVETISPVIENTTCKVTVLVDNPEGKIKPGMFAFVNIDGQTFSDCLLVPKEAVIPRQNRELLFIIRENRAVWNYVTSGRRNNEYIEILDSREGLEPGEQVIISGHFTLGHDVPVRVVESLENK